MSQSELHNKKPLVVPSISISGSVSDNQTGPASISATHANSVSSNQHAPVFGSTLSPLYMQPPQVMLPLHLTLAANRQSDSNSSVKTEYSRLSNSKEDEVTNIDHNDNGRSVSNQNLLNVTSNHGHTAGTNLSSTRTRRGSHSSNVSYVSNVSYKSYIPNTGDVLGRKKTKKSSSTENDEEEVRKLRKILFYIMAFLLVCSLSLIALAIVSAFYLDPEGH